MSLSSKEFDEKIKYIVNPEKHEWEDVSLIKFVVVNLILGIVIGALVAIILLGLPI